MLIPGCKELSEDNVLELHENGVLPDHCNYVLHMQGKELQWPDPKEMRPFKEAPKSFKLTYYNSIGNPNKEWHRRING